MHNFQRSVECRNSLDNDPDGGAIKLMVALGIVHTAIKVTPFNTRTIDIEQCNECSHCLRRTRVLCSDPIDGRSQLAAFVVQLPG